MKPEAPPHRHRSRGVVRGEYVIHFVGSGFFHTPASLQDIRSGNTLDNPIILLRMNVWDHKSTDSGQKYSRASNLPYIRL